MSAERFSFRSRFRRSVLALTLALTLAHSEDRRQDVLKVISAILGYTEEELREIELTRQHNGKWLPTIFAKSKQQAPPIGEVMSDLG